jgi:preprotein translocase subunit SecB
MPNGELMSDSTPQNPDQGNGNPPAAGNSGEAIGAEAPSLRVLAQYLKDLSFESPRAPMVFQPGAQPKFEVNVDVGARAINQTQFEVELSVTARSEQDGKPMFVIEATYAGVFEIVNIPQEQLEPVLLIECPRILFPFARQIVAETTQSGNFPPLMLDPLDFLAIYEARKQGAFQNTPTGASAHA